MCCGGSKREGAAGGKRRRREGGYLVVSFVMLVPMVPNLEATSKEGFACHGFNAAQICHQMMKCAMYFQVNLAAMFGVGALISVEEQFRQNSPSILEGKRTCIPGTAPL